MSNTNRIGLLAATQIPTGYAAWGTAKAGDFNGDGKKDTVTDVYDYNSGQSFLSVALGNGDGTFQSAKLTPMTNDNWFYVGDLNGDHKDDVIVVYGGNLDVYLSNGDGTFATAVTYATGGSDAVAASIVDLNGDNIPDLMVVDNSSQVITLLGNGDGTFAAPTTVSYSGNLQNPVVIADLNGDGKLDFAGADSSTGEVAVYLADGSGGYSGPTLLGSDTGNYAYSLVAGDLNGDGKPELVASGDNYITNNLTIYVNSGDGTFSDGVSQWAGLDTEGLAIADVDGDNKNDIVAGNFYGADITVLLGNGDGTVQPPTAGYAVGGYPWANPVLADFNGDGKPDVVVPDDEFSLAYLQGYGDGTFRAAQDYFSPLPANGGDPWTETVATGDFNGDGIPDVVLGNCCSSDMPITVFLGKADGSLQTGVNYVAADGTDSMDYVAVGDFNEDNKLDIAAASDTDNLVHVFLGNGDGTFQPDVTYGSGTASLDAILATDLNKDGKTDLAVIDDNGEIDVLLNDGLGGFLPDVTYPLSSAGYDLAAADLNGDGNVDLVTTGTWNNSVDVLLGNGDGTFQPYQSLAVGSSPQGVAVADVNGDGKPDVVASSYDDGTIAVLLGNGDGSFQDPAFYPVTTQDTSISSPYPMTIRTVDLDGDGKLDLVWTNEQYGTVGVLYGNGDGTFSGPVEFPTGGYPWGIATADMNGDGALDVLTANYDQIGATVLLNAGGSRMQVTASPNPAQYGEAVTLTATVTPTVRGVTAVPTGTVALVAGSNNFGSPTLANGGASVDLTSLAPGTYDTSASYSGDSTFRPNTGNVSFTINQATTTTTVTSSATPVVTGNSVTFTATVTSSTSGVPTGTVTFMNGGTTLGTGTLDVNGNATYSTLALPAGTYNITAVYAGDANYEGSTSSVLSQVVNDLVATTTTLTSSASPVVTGKSVTFTATVTPGTTGTPTGTVTFMDGATSLGTGTLDANGKATLSTTSLAAATHSVTAVYGGDTNYAGSTSTALSQVVLATAPDYTLGANSTTATVTAGGSATFAITATADQYFNGTVSFSCGTLPKGATCQFTPASLTPTNGHPATTTLVVTTTSEVAALEMPVSPARRNGLVVLANLGGIGVFGALVLGDFSKRKRLCLMVLVGIMLLVMMLGLSGCGGGSTHTNPNATPLGQATLQVTATATAGTTGGNTAAHSLTLTINVQK